MPSFWHAFLPLFVAFDGVGLLPLFWALAHRLTPAQRRKAVAQAVLTALLVAAVFLCVSRVVFELMGLSLADIMVAGGVILIVVSLRDLFFAERPPRGSYPNPGVVPLGVPLLTGPAVLTTVLLVRDQYGWVLTAVSLIANMALVWVVLRCAGWLMHRLGEEGAEVISKIFSLILTAFGVMLIRRGIMMWQG